MSNKQLSYNELIEFATKKYFGNVDAKKLDDVLNCFHDTAHFTVQTAFVRHDGKAAIRRMFEDFFAGYKSIVHKDFTCTVDQRNQRITASFVAELIDANGKKTQLNNTNFWRLRDGKFQEVFVYMSGENVLV